MKSRFESAGWLTAIARLVESSDVDAAAGALAEAIDVAVEHEGSCLLPFHRDAPPEVFHHTLEPAGRRHYVDRYVAGPYLLDPLYQLAVGDQKPGVCRFRDQSPDRFRSSEYYRQYCERTHLKDEMDFLVDVSANTTLALVVGRRTRRFKKAELEIAFPRGPVRPAQLRERSPAGAGRQPAPASHALLRKLRRGSAHRAGTPDYPAAAARPLHQVGRPRARHRAGHRDGPQAQPVRQARHNVAV